MAAPECVHDSRSMQENLATRCAPRFWRTAPLSLAAWSLAALCAAPAHALDSPAPDPAAAGAQTTSLGSGAARAGADSGEAETPDSIEQGQTQLPDSFEHRPIAALLQESRLVGLRDTTINVQFRSFYLDRDNFEPPDSLAWAIGGSAGVKTGYFGDFAALGATTYTSQRLAGPLDEDGTTLLQPGQNSYTAIGELYGQFKLTDTILAIAGRKGFDTPFINEYDSRMTPNTFVVYALQGATGSTDGSTALRFGAGYVDKIKPRNAEDFESMATAAGAPSGVDRGVYVAGANFKSGQFSLGAIEYYSEDIIQITYGEFKYAVPLASRVTLRFGAQYTDQHSAGEDLLTGKTFHADQSGFKAELGYGPTLFTVARTLTAVGATSSNGSGTDLVSPWGSYPGYTHVQIENFYRAGEDATLLRAAYNFPRVTGLSVYALYVDGSTPKVVDQYAQREYDMSLQWIAKDPALQGLTLLVRYGHVAQSGPKDEHENELRLVAYYQWR